MVKKGTHEENQKIIDTFAAAALPGVVIVTKTSRHKDPESVANRAYDIGEAMWVRRGKKKLEDGAKNSVS